jgi:linoleoyl-CoA desaturase
VLSWYLGGLNFQVEHHLFPNVCHVHYRALAPIVERACRTHGLRYQAQPTLRAALSANLRWLRALGARPPAPDRSEGWAA